MWAWLIFGAVAAISAAFAVAPLVRAPKARPAAAVIAVAVAGAGLALYALLGRPELAARAFAPPESQDLTALVASLATKVHERPNELEGWVLLGRGYFALGAKDEAAKALGEAVRLAKAQRLPATQLATLLSDYGVALSQAAGEVTPLAASAFGESLAADPKGSAARYYLGLAAAARGDAATAERLWQALLADTPPDAPYRGEIVDRLAALRAEAVARGEAAPDVQAMVTGLAARLKANPDDLDGWTRLIRAYAVLGKEEMAHEALADARAHFAADAVAMRALAQTARDSHLE